MLLSFWGKYLPSAGTRDPELQSRTLAPAPTNDLPIFDEHNPTGK
jgi:hypothetical protein